MGAASARDREVAWLMRETGTDGLRHRDFGTLSGENATGCFARILAQETDLLLLTNPPRPSISTTRPDLRVLRAGRNGYGVAVVTHDLNGAGQFCDRLVLMSARARIVAQGTPRQVLTRDLLTEAYESPIVVTEHPITGTPLVWPEPASAGGARP
jgi:iron complex transport system ATP-binding protein